MYLTPVHFVRALNNTRAVIMRSGACQLDLICDMETALSERELDTIFTKVSQCALIFQIKYIK